MPADSTCLAGAAGFGPTGPACSGGCGLRAAEALAARWRGGGRRWSGGSRRSPKASSGRGGGEIAAEVAQCQPRCRCHWRCHCHCRDRQNANQHPRAASAKVESGMGAGRSTTTPTAVRSNTTRPPTGAPDRRENGASASRAADTEGWVVGGEEAAGMVETEDEDEVEVEGGSGSESGSGIGLEVEVEAGFEIVSASAFVAAAAAAGAAAGAGGPSGAPRRALCGAALGRIQHPGSTEEGSTRGVAGNGNTGIPGAAAARGSLIRVPGSSHSRPGASGNPSGRVLP